jgi:hypothetical protein
MPIINLDKLDKFTKAHEARREALSSHSPAMYERVAGMYEHLGCPINAAAIRAQAVEVAAKNARKGKGGK